MLRNRLRSRALGALAALAFALAVPVTFAPPAAAAWTECPALTPGAGCSMRVVVTPPAPDPWVLWDVDPLMSPYSGDDFLVGVVDEGRARYVDLRIRSVTGAPLFAFDGQGICVYLTSDPGCPYGPTRYEGPGVSFSDYCAPSCAVGTVHIDFGEFADSCDTPQSRTTFFSLEGRPTAVEIELTTSTPSRVYRPFAEATSVQGPVGTGSATADSGSGPSTRTTQSRTAGPVTADVLRAYADTTYRESGEAESEAARVTVTAGATTTAASGVRADASVDCAGGAPIEFAWSSTLADLTVNGVPVLAPTVPQFVSLTTPCGPGGGLWTHYVTYGPVSREVSAIRVSCPLLGLDLRVATAKVELRT